jgi:hypothetical protein
MQVINRTRIKGSAVLLTLVTSGLFTNCGWCPDPTTKGVSTDQTTDGPMGPVAACGTVVDYYHHESLKDAACQLSVDAEVKKGDSAACLYWVDQGDIQRCPGHGTTEPFSLSTPFTVFWTICNHSDRDAESTDTKDYNLQIYPIDTSTNTESSTPYKTIKFTQPALKKCACQDVGLNFNDGGANVLPLGTYVLRLDGIYEARNSTTPPVYTKGCAAANGFQKITIQP